MYCVGKISNLPIYYCDQDKSNENETKEGLNDKVAQYKVISKNRKQNNSLQYSPTNVQQQCIA